MTKKYINKITTYLDDKDIRSFDSICENLGLESSSFARLAIKEKIRSEGIMLKQTESISTEPGNGSEGATETDMKGDNNNDK